MDVYTVKEIRALEQKTMTHQNLTEIELMQRAGFMLTKDFLHRVKPGFDHEILVLAGVGNNGGDALVMAIELHKMGYHSEVFVIGDMQKASDAFRFYFDAVGKVDIIDDEVALERVQEKIFKADILIEGIFGIGLSKPVQGFRLVLFDYMNQSDSIVYSVDIPSGVHPDNGLIMNKAVHANFTGIVGAYKIGNLIQNAMDYHGEVSVLDIGLVTKEEASMKLVDLKQHCLKKQKRLHQSNKYTYGLGLFIGGNPSMMGSIQMAAISGMRSGLGISVILTTKIDKPYTQFYPELIIHDAKEVESYLHRAKVVVFGPGIEHNEHYKETLHKLLNDNNKPIVVDATGLDYIKLEPISSPNVILTPHLGELSRLLEIDSKEIEKDPLKYLMTLTKLGYHVLLKGPCNILASGNEVRFIQVFNTSLATAGSGDILSGILASQLVIKPVLEAMIDSVYIHAKASDLAVSHKSSTGIIATDFIQQIPYVFQEGTDV
ncbi:MAG: NAD(P)H-hydrate dehydratase [Bacilli bacterium]|nr:NAD(P)H-hydrate dehydratase [Bacilli bacterium]MBN2877478.1 NAD(P)H-hydrate dehydratase [Bacilli bacterium]